MIAPALPAVQSVLHASPAELNTVFTALLLSGAIGTPLIGRLGDLIDKRWILLWTLIITCAGVVIAALATSIEALALGQLLQGIGLAMVPLSVGLVNDLLDRDRAGLTTGLVVSAAASSSMVGLLVAGPVVAAFGYRWIYWLALCILIPCTLSSPMTDLTLLAQREIALAAVFALDWVLPPS